MQLRLISPIHINRAAPPVCDPVFTHTAARVELKLCFAITSLVSAPGRKDLNNQFGGFVELAIIPKGRCHPVIANPNDIRHNIISLGKDQAWGEIASPQSLLLAEDDDVAPDVIWISNNRMATALWDDGKFHEAPELVVEVLSPGSANERRDREAKLQLYSRRGVSE